ERLQFRREREHAISLIAKQRLDPETIARDEQLTLLRIPNREREHPPKTVEASLAPLFVRVHDRFRIAMRAKRVAFRFELATKLRKVVKLAVVRDPDGAV